MSCAFRRFGTHTLPAKPSNKELHEETEKKLKELVHARMEQDEKHILPIINVSKVEKMAEWAKYQNTQNIQNTQNGNPSH